MKTTYLLAALLAASAITPANALTVHTGTFLSSVTNYNGFEAIGPNDYPSGTPYTEQGITVEYIGTASIWTTSQVMEGEYSWYPNGGGTGYTEVTFAATDAIQFALGSGWFSGSPTLQYEVLLADVVIASGTITGVSLYTGFGYYGFSGEMFDELHLQVQNDNLPFNPDAYEAGAYDAFSIGTAGVVPEPASWALMIAGFGMVGFAMRRRPVALTA